MNITPPPPLTGFICITWMKRILVSMRNEHVSTRLRSSVGWSIFTSTGSSIETWNQRTYCWTTQVRHFLIFMSLRRQTDITAPSHRLCPNTSPSTSWLWLPSLPVEFCLEPWGCLPLGFHSNLFCTHREEGEKGTFSKHKKNVFHFNNVSSEWIPIHNSRWSTQNPYSTVVIKVLSLRTRPPVRFGSGCWTSTRKRQNFWICWNSW